MPDDPPENWDADALDAAILEAHDAGDAAKLARLYQLAALHMREQGAEEAAYFLMTQAMVFALDAGLPLAGDLQRELRTAGREA